MLFLCFNYVYSKWQSLQCSKNILIFAFIKKDKSLVSGLLSFYFVLKFIGIKIYICSPSPMENFVVSARKYRPMTFNTVVGQQAITSTLKNAIRNNHLAHAFLFTGPRGVGKTTCARILAKTINCLNVTPDFEPCNTCTSCETFNSGQSLNIFELDAASNNSVEDIRSLVEQVRYAPVGGNKLTYKSVIDNLHILDYDYFFRVTEEILTGNTSSVLRTFDEILAIGFDGHHFIAGLSSHFRNLLVCKDAVTVELLEVSEGIREKYLSQSQQCTPALLFTLLEEANRCDTSYRSAQNQRLHVEISLIKICMLAKTT